MNQKRPITSANPSNVAVVVFGGLLFSLTSASWRTQSALCVASYMCIQG